MINRHAAALEGILLDRGLKISKGNHVWEISAVGTGTPVTYRPDTGVISVPSAAVKLKYAKRALRGSPETIAGIIEGMVR